MDLNNTSDQIVLTYILRTFHSTAAEQTLFSSAHGIFFRVGHTEVPQKIKNITNI